MKSLKFMKLNTEALVQKIIYWWIALEVNQLRGSTYSLEADWAYGSTNL